MRMYDIIDKKRKKMPLNKEEIEWFVDKYSNNEIPDYQASALLMAICLNGMNNDETAILTNAMAHSGEMYDLSQIEGIKVDKHSTGGVGDKVTLIVLPIVASLGVPVVKMSGKGLGFTGGTIDKLNSISNLQLEYSLEEVISRTNEYKICEMMQSDKLCLADKKLYELRDLTATVESIQLIASSIMSKKLALGADKILLDVTCGSGAFMRNLEDARKLARTMVDIGNNNERETIAVITNMDQPLGKTIGNSLEIIETIESLKGRIEADVLTVVKTLGAYMLKLAGYSDNIEENMDAIERQIFNGEAYKKFEQWIEIQNGNIEQIRDISLLPKSNNIVPVYSNYAGYIHNINAMNLGIAVCEMGGGRLQKGDKIDYGVGIVLNYKCGDKVDKGNALCYLHVNDMNNIEQIVEKVQNSYTISDSEIEKEKMILDILV